MGNVSKRVKYEKDYYLEYFSCWYFNRTLSIDGGQKDVFEGQYKKLFSGLFFAGARICPASPGRDFCCGEQQPEPGRKFTKLGSVAA